MSKAKAAGAELKNPGRHAGRSAAKGARPLGDPYQNMTVAQKKAWLEFSAEMPWLNSSHRVLLRLACYWAAKLDSPRAKFGVSATQALSSILSKLGATPVDESKVNHGGGEEEDPTDAFFTRGRPN
ncbi:hypothetical protein ABWU93_11390 [Xanthomonas translucens pv. translucens]|uniref:hypothetical protein n=1 Tax=Xanthomonas campestris pv. translucens TaxID=343 RepID=UPI003F70D0B4